MSAKMDLLVKKLTDAMLAVSKKKSSAYDSTATVRRIDGDTVWVHLPGGVDETPIQKTIACSPGDTVQVRVSEGRAWIQGNHSAPPTDDTTAIHARRVANKATTMAETAEETATEAQVIAAGAQETAESAEAKADDAIAAAGAGITTDTLHYLATDLDSGVTINTPGWTTTIQTITEAAPYLWTYHTYHKASGVSVNTNPVITGVYGPQGPTGPQGATGDDGVSVTSVQPQYNLSTSTSSATGTWGNSLVYESGKYIWTRDMITYSDGRSVPSAEICNYALTEACSTAEQALNIAEGIDEHFWSDNTGAHITKKTQDEYIADPANGGGNTLITSEGMAVRNGQTELATFGASGAQIGVTSGQHLSLTASVPFRSYNASGNLIGQIGNDGRLQFGAGTNASGTESVAIGKNATALGADAVALGWGANAYGEGSRSLGLYTDAHAASQTVLGMWNEQKYIDDEERRDDDIAFIFGNGYYGAPSNAVEMDWCGNIVVGSSNGGQNIRNTLLLGVGLEKAAAGNGQLVIGTYNIKKTKPLIIGNGTSSTRANVFEVDWSGNLEAAGDITDGNGNMLSDKADASSVVTPDDYVIAHGTSGSWRYRKWHSGKIEAWFEGTFSCAASTTARGSLYYSTWSLTIPNNAIGFTATPNTLIGNTGDSTTVIAVNGAASSATAMSGKVWRYASSSSALIISAKIYAWQN